MSLKQSPLFSCEQGSGYLETRMYVPLTLLLANERYGQDDYYSYSCQESSGVDKNASRITLTVWNYHICYNYSYREPMLYYEVSESDGTPLSAAFMQEILMAKGLESSVLVTAPVSEKSDPYFSKHIKQCRMVDSPTRPIGAEGSGVRLLVSQEHHPILHRPFYMIHPCDTASFMKLSESIGNENDEVYGTQCTNRDLFYLCSWLCMVGRPFGLGLSTSAWCSIRSGGELI